MSTLETARNTLSCMVLGTSEHRRLAIADTAEQAGWVTSDSDGAKTSRAALLREPRQLIVIDLTSESGSAPETLKRLAERVARDKSTLLMLCGNEGNVMEEIWARQLGVWIYLPGVLCGSDLTSLLREANHVSRRQRAERPASNDYPASAHQTA